MKYHFIREELVYNGDQLANHWIYKNFGILGDAAVAFVGPCQVDRDMMVDLEDVLNDDFIYSKKMLHFIIEIFGVSLKEGVLVQRLFSSVIEDKINHQLGGAVLKRRGDDLFFEDTAKLSVSICTASPTSILIHTGLNIDAAGAPVEAAGLISDLKMEDVQMLGTQCLKTLAEEWEDIKMCCCKVRAVV